MNCQGVSAVVSLNRSFLFLSMFCSVLEEMVKQVDLKIYNMTSSEV